MEKNPLKNNKSLKNLFLFFVGVVVYGSLLFGLLLFENGAGKSNIKSFFDAMWYSIVTLTTVGYGDNYPVSVGGKIIGYVFVFSSLGILGLLIGKISSLISEIKENKKFGYSGTNFKNHIVIMGWNKFAQTVLDQMIGSGMNVAIVTNNRNHIDLINEAYDSKQVYTLLSDFYNFDLIKKANIGKCHILFINLEDDAEKLVFLINSIKVFGEEIQHAVILEASELKSTFQMSGASFVLSKNDIASKMIASFIFEPDAAKYTEDLIASAVEDEDFDIQEFKVIESNPYLNCSYLDTFFNIKKKFDAILIGLVKINGKKRVLYKNPDDGDLRIELNDFLIVITSGAISTRLEESFGIGEGSTK
jgi:voltage-gated potassium channel